MSIRVEIASAIYPPECLQETIAAYQELCSVKVISESPGGCSVEIRQSSNTIDEEQLKNEFLNYLLDLSLEKHLAGFEKSNGTDRVSAT